MDYKYNSAEEVLLAFYIWGRERNISERADVMATFKQWVNENGEDIPPLYKQSWRDTYTFSQLGDEVRRREIEVANAKSRTHRKERGNE